MNTRHFWSPRLNLELETTENGGTRIEGNYGPNANVWGPFLYGYLLTGTFGLFAGVFGFAQCLVGQQPWALWIFGAMLATGIGLYVGAQFGQKLCDEEQFHKSLSQTGPPLSQSPRFQPKPGAYIPGKSRHDDERGSLLEKIKITDQEFPFTIEVWHRLPRAPLRNGVKGCSK